SGGAYGANKTSIRDAHRRKPVVCHHAETAAERTTSKRTAPPAELSSTGHGTATRTRRNGKSCSVQVRRRCSRTRPTPVRRPTRRAPSTPRTGAALSGVPWLRRARSDTAQEPPEPRQRPPLPAREESLVHLDDDVR